MYAIVKNNKIVEAPVNLRSKFNGVQGFHLLTEEERFAHGWYPLTLINEFYDMKTQNRSEVPSYEIFEDHVIGTYTIINKSVETIEQDIKAEFETAVQKHINKIVVSKGYDNENSISKYLVVGNPFYEECKAISLWIGSVWTYLYKVQSDVVSGLRTAPTTKSLITELPEL